MKTITICGKEYPIACNAYTRFEYKRIFNNGIFEDLGALQEINTEQEKIRQEMVDKSEEEIATAINSVILTKLDGFLDVVEKIAYILIYTANNKCGTFKEFMESIEQINLNESWISEVTEFAVNSFCGQGVN